MDVNAIDNDGSTALHFAAVWDHPDTCLLLLSRGADLMAVDDDNKTALDLYGHALNYISSTDRPKLSDAVKEERRNALHVAFANYFNTKIAAQKSALESENATQKTVFESEITVLKRPAQANAYMLFSDKFADVVFEVEGERIPAHKVIVAACSEYMNALLSNPQWQENADDRMSVVKLSDLSAVSVRAMLRFIYTGEVDETAYARSCTAISLHPLNQFI